MYISYICTPLLSKIILRFFILPGRWLFQSWSLRSSWGFSWCPLWCLSCLSWCCWCCSRKFISLIMPLLVSLALKLKLSLHYKLNTWTIVHQHLRRCEQSKQLSCPPAFSSCVIPPAVWSLLFCVRWRRWGEGPSNQSAKQAAAINKSMFRAKAEKQLWQMEHQKWRLFLTTECKQANWNPGQRQELPHVSSSILHLHLSLRNIPNFWQPSGQDGPWWWL